MAVNLYQTGTSGLLAAQQQLATTGHNIANVNTQGYSRQRIEQHEGISSNQGDNVIGSGTYVKDISRIFSSFSYREQQITGNQASYTNKLSNQLDQLDATMGTYGGQISASMDGFYSSLHGISEKPDDITLRSMVLSQGESITRQVQDLQSSMSTQQKSANIELGEMANRITIISSDIARINSQIQTSNGTDISGQSNDLLDQRERLLSELNSLVKVSTVEDKDGVMTVMIGKGQTLVAGVTALSMTSVAGSPDPLQTRMQINGKNSSFVVSGASLGGEAGAIVNFRDNNLKRASAELDLLAMGINQTINQAQSSGLDLNAQQGANIFSDLNTTAAQQSRSFSYPENTSTLSLEVNITDISQLATDEYELMFDGANYQLTNLNSGVVTSLGASGAGTYAPAGLGFEFTEMAGPPSTNDKFLIRPTHNGAENFNVSLTNPESIAASSPLQVTANENNVSEGAVSIVSVTDPVAARNLTSVTFPSLTVDVYESGPGVFDYRVYDSANPPPAAVLSAGSYLAGNSVTIDIPAAPVAYQIEISGSLAGLGPNAREQFVIGDAFGVGNGNNMLDMAATQNEKILGGSNKTFAQAMAGNASTVGSSASSTQRQAQTADAMSEQAISRHQSMSGVNLDEEAANMLKYQQAYQAAAQIISVANTIFDTILSSLR